MNHEENYAEIAERDFARHVYERADREDYHESMRLNGWTYTGAVCHCLDGGEFGHEYSCGWEKTAGEVKA